MKSFRFDKNVRLRNSADYQAVFDQVDIKISRKHFLCLSRNNTLGRPRVGLIIAKKQVRLAVNRNRIKRIVRDSFRCYQGELPALDIIFLSRKGLDLMDNAHFHSELESLWKRLRK